MFSFENNGLLFEAGFGVGNIVHAEPCGDGGQYDKRHPNKAGVLQPDLFGHACFRPSLRLATQCAEHAGGNHQRHDKLHGGHAQVAQTGVQTHGRAFFGFGVEKADVGHTGREVAAAQTAQQRQNHHSGVGSFRVLHGKAQADGGQQQAGSGNGGPFAAAEHRHHKRIENPQCRAGQGRQCGQPEELVFGEFETDAGQVHHSHAPNLPNGKGQQQRWNGNPQVALGDFLTGALPELRVFRLPVGNDFGHRIIFLLKQIDLKVQAAFQTGKKQPALWRHYWFCFDLNEKCIQINDTQVQPYSSINAVERTPDQSNSAPNIIGNRKPPMPPAKPTAPDTAPMLSG